MKTYVIFALAACAYLLLRRRLSGTSVFGSALPGRDPHPRFPSFDEWAELSPLHHDRARRLLRAFAVTYQKTFASCARALVTDLHELRSRALTALYELRMRLPNDARAYDSMTSDIERVERSTLIHIDDVTGRCHLGLVHAGPVGDHYYGHRYRAANDVPE